MSDHAPPVQPEAGPTDEREAFDATWLAAHMARERELCWQGWQARAAIAQQAEAPVAQQAEPVKVRRLLQIGDGQMWADVTIAPASEESPLPVAQQVEARPAMPRRVMIPAKDLPSPSIETAREVIAKHRDVLVALHGAPALPVVAPADPLYRGKCPGGGRCIHGCHHSDRCYYERNNPAPVAAGLTDAEIRAGWMDFTEDGANVGGGTSLDGWTRAARWAEARLRTKS